MFRLGVLMTSIEDVSSTQKRIQSMKSSRINDSLLHGLK